MSKHANYTDPLKPLTVESYDLPSDGVHQGSLPTHLLTFSLGQGCNLFERHGGQTRTAFLGTETFTLTPAGLERDWYWQDPASILCLELSPSVFNDVVQASDLNSHCLNLIPRFGDLDPQLQRLGRILLSEVQNPGLASELYFDSLTQTLVIQLLRRHTTLGLQSIDSTQDISSQRLQSVLDYIHAFPQDPCRLSDLASLAHLSSYHFIRVFQQTTGFTPYQYVLHHRIELAQQLLKDPQLSITAVAHQVGLSEGQLTRHFKRLKGVTPATFRRNIG